MADDPTIREFRDDDLDDVLDVLRLALGEPPGLQRTADLFAWKHVDNPFGRSLMLVAEIEGTIAGFRAFMRWDLVTPDGATVRCGRAVDTATHPDHQRRGVFRALTETGLAMAADRGIDLIFNTPNAKSGAGYLKMGWGEVGPIGIMVRPRPRMITRSQPWEHEPDESVRAAVEAGWLVDALSREARGLRTRRTGDYLLWRFGAHPTARYVATGDEGGAAIGRLSFRSGRRELVISEAGGTNSASAIRTLIRAHSPDYAAGWFSERSPDRTAAVRAGLLAVPRVAALTLVARPIDRVVPDPLQPDNWDLALGDLELL